MNFKYKVSAVFVLGAVVGMSVYLVVTGDVSTPAAEVAACFPPDAAVCGVEGCTAA